MSAIASLLAGTSPYRIMRASVKLEAWREQISYDIRNLYMKYGFAARRGRICHLLEGVHINGIGKHMAVPAAGRCSFWQHYMK